MLCLVLRRELTMAWGAWQQLFTFQPALRFVLYFDILRKPICLSRFTFANTPISQSILCLAMFIVKSIHNPFIFYKQKQYSTYLKNHIFWFIHL